MSDNAQTAVFKAFAAADTFVVFGRKVKPSKARIVRRALWNLIRS